MWDTCIECRRLHLERAWSYRAGDGKRGRVAVELHLKNPGTKPWTLAGALLRGPKGEELTPLPEDTPVSILPGFSGRVMLEFEATMEQAQGAYTLILWDAAWALIVLFHFACATTKDLWDAAQEASTLRVTNP
ncbi:MAG TPA: DUF2381 family protein [Archangium sp.]|nr:DUF2381 family protein [Archangium sp.]